MAGVVAATIVGNLAADPELKFLQSGKAQVRFRVIANARRLNQETQQWEENGVFSPWCVAFGDQAEHISETLTKGMRVIVQGKLEERRYEDKQGQPRTSLDFWVDEIGPSLRYATAKVTKAQRGGGGGGFNSGGFSGGGYAQGGGSGAGYGGGNASAGRGPARADDPWGNVDAGGFNDEPPF